MCTRFLPGVGSSTRWKAKPASVWSGHDDEFAWRDGVHLAPSAAPTTRPAASGSLQSNVMISTSSAMALTLDQPGDKNADHRRDYLSGN